MKSVLNATNQIGKWVIELKEENENLKKEVASLKKGVTINSDKVAEQVFAKLSDQIVEKIHARLSNGLNAPADPRLHGHGMAQMHVNLPRDCPSEHFNGYTPE